MATLQIPPRTQITTKEKLSGVIESRHTTLLTSRVRDHALRLYEQYLHACQSGAATAPFEEWIKLTYTPSRPRTKFDRTPAVIYDDTDMTGSDARDFGLPTTIDGVERAYAILCEQWLHTLHVVAARLQHDDDLKLFELPSIALTVNNRSQCRCQFKYFFKI